MKKILSVLAVLVVWGTIYADLSGAAGTSLTYRLYPKEGDTKKILDETRVQYKKQSDRQTLLIREMKEGRCVLKDEFTLDEDDAVTKWTRVCKEDGTDFTAERDGKILIIKGQLKGEAVDKEIELGLKALYIYPKYSLGKFALSETLKTEFWTLRRDELSKLPMKARNEGEVTIMVNGKETEAIKVYYSIEGKLREKYYNENYYYRKSDGLFLKKEEMGGKVEDLIKEK